MKFKPASLVVLAWTLAATACSQINQTTYWKHIDDGSTPSPANPQVALNQDMAACTRAMKDMAQTDPHDFDDCMLGEGWARQNTVSSPPSLQTADNSPQNAPPAPPQMALTEDEKKDEIKQAAGIAHDMRQDELVPLGGQVSLGLQGYQDRYTASNQGENFNIHTNYFGGTAGYTYRNGEHTFWTIDGRLAHGNESYNSPAGVMDDVPQYEGEARLTVGEDTALGGGWISPYAGFGGRMFLDNGEGHATNLGAADYDTRIEQLYAPLGAIWRSLLPGDVTMADTLEVDPLLLGNVDQRLSNIGGPNADTTQNLLTGYGIRGEAMFGVPMENDVVELGPFFRYWNINNSSVNVQSCAGSLCEGYVEPYNTRLQIGVTTRVSF